MILAGGLGTRLSEETETRPKPMVEIGGRPILWHIMKHYAHYGFERIRGRPGLQGRRDQALLHRLLPSLNGDITVDLASGGVTRTRRAAGRLDRPPGRHRR